MIHNGIEYGLMQAYAEGFDILKNANIDALPAEHRFDFDLADIAEVWRRGSVIPSWLLDLTSTALADNPTLSEYSGYRRGFRRRALDRECGDRRGRAGRSPDRGALRPFPLPQGTHLRRKNSLRDARGLRRPQGAEAAGRFEAQMTTPQSEGAIVRDKRPQAKRKPENCAFVIFGVTGDLTHRLVMPSLYNLAAEHLLPEKFCVVGVARKGQSDDELRDSLMKGLQQIRDAARGRRHRRKLLECVTFVEADAKDPPSFDRLREHLDSLECAQDTGGNRLFYLATPPAAFAPTARELGRTGMMKENGAWRRLVIEKPFGTDLASAKALNAELLKIMDEHQIYRIDHYLGKETVQNILVLRFANGMFEPIWNRNHIDHIQITVEEKLGVGHRGSFYDATGALRDMVPNHLFQLLSLVAMEPPARFDAHSVRSEKAEVLAAIQQPEPGGGAEEFGARAISRRHGSATTRSPDYRKTEDVKPGSTTETYVALKLMIDNWRWAGVPFYLRTGKALGHKRTEVAIKFKQAPFSMFSRHAGRPAVAELPRHRHRADRGHRAAVQRQGPGPDHHHRRRRDEVPLQGLFQGRARTGYETLIYDCMIGDNILFQRADGVEAGWQAVQPFLDAWKNAGANGLKPTRPAARARPRPTSCWRATAAAGGSWRDIGGRGRPQASSSPTRRRWRRPRPSASMARIAGQIPAGSRSASPAARARKKLYELLGSDAYRAQNPLGSRALVHRRRAFCSDRDPLNNMAVARATFLDRYAPAGQHPPDPDRRRRSGRERPRLYERELKAFYGADVSIPRGRCSISS